MKWHIYYLSLSLSLFLIFSALSIQLTILMQTSSRGHRQTEKQQRKWQKSQQLFI